MSSLRIFAARTLCGGHYSSTVTETVSDVWQEHIMRKGHLYIDAPDTSLGEIPYSQPRGAPPMSNEESIIWWKLLPSRQKHERSTSKSSEMGSYINFK